MDEQLPESVAVGIVLDSEKVAQFNFTATLSLIVTFMDSLQLAFVHMVIVEWLDQEHEWHTEECNYYTRLHQGSLHWHKISIFSYTCLGWLLIHTAVEEHGNHGHDDTRGLLLLGGHGVPVGQPLANDHPVHEAKEGDEHHELGDGLEDQVDPQALVDKVRHPESCAEKHLSDTVHDSGLHFEAVEVHDFLLTSHPCPVETEWVDAFFVWSNHRNGFVLVCNCLVDNFLIRH